MIRNYIKIALRNMTKHSAYSVINIAGLSVGLTAFILIALWIQHELSYDRFHERSSQLYRIIENQYYANNELFPVAVTPAPLGPYLKENFPEIENATRTSEARFLFQYGEVKFNELGYMVDPAFFEMFSLNLIKGDKKTLLSKLENIVISESLAKKYFHDVDPLGEVFKINNNDFAVTGVFRDFPENSHMKFDYILPFELFVKFGWDSLKRWDRNGYYTYAQLRKDAEAETVNSKIKDVINRYVEGSGRTEIYLQPLSSIHLHSKFTADIGGHGDIQYIYIFSAVAAFVLIIACINFMNLSTARSTRRSKEVGIRKVVGAARTQLIRQFLMESIMFVLISLLVALVLAQLLLPSFNEISGKVLELSFESTQLWIILSCIMIVTSVISGSYPALFMSSFKPVTTLKGALRSGKGAVIFRKVLVITQFTITVLLISGTIIVYHQLTFIRNKKLGFEKNNVISFRVSDEISKNLEPFKNELLSASGVGGVTYTSNSLTYVGTSGGGMEWEGKDPDVDILFHFLAVDYDFIKTFNIEMFDGRNFSREMATDSSAIILNEEAIRQMGLENPVDKKVKWDDQLTIIGVVKDFHFKSVHEKIEPLVIMVAANRYNRVYVKLNSGDLTAAVGAVNDVYKKFSPDRPFDYTFLNDDFDRLYRAEQRTGTIFNYFAWIAIFISCLGLFGLVMFTIEQRVKEIGIRKVLGASVSNLFSLISSDFIRLIIISNVIAIPVAWYAMNKWLDSFAYRITIHWATFVIAAVASILIAWLTMSYQSIKAAIANPVNSLRNE